MAHVFIDKRQAQRKTGRLSSGIQIKFRPEDIKALTDEAWRQHISVSQLVRDSIFEKYNPRIPTLPFPTKPVVSSFNVDNQMTLW